MVMTTTAPSGAIRSLIPARLDRLRWTPFHTRLVMALGIAWVLDGLEITIASSVGGVLTNADTLNLSSTAIGAVATVYLLGEVVGALVFGRLSDRLGRRKLFMVTLAVYLVGSGLTALTAGHGSLWIVYLYLTRFIAGTGIGGEYAAINSAIDEMIPARYRGQVDIGVNGTYWAGAIIGTVGALFFLNLLPESIGWRLGFLLGPALAFFVLYVRRHLPESPRWLLTHGRADEAERAMREIESLAESTSGEPMAALDEHRAIEIRPARVDTRALMRVLFVEEWRRSVLGASLMISQSFLYNAIFFTYVLVLTKFYGVHAAAAPIYLIGFAVGNLLGPLTIGRLFDSVGRKPMIAGTYLISGVALAITAVLFDRGMLTATTQTLAWCLIFFFASAGASAGYLTVSEVFPIEVRARAIAVFFSVAQIFGALGPVLYGHLIGNGSDPTRLFVGYLIGGGVMVAGGLVELVLGVKAERRPLESVATPLSAVPAAVPRAAGASATFSPARPNQP